MAKPNETTNKSKTRPYQTLLNQTNESRLNRKKPYEANKTKLKLNQTKTKPNYN